MIRLACFDMDGTVFESFFDWQAIKTRLNVQSGNILQEILGKNEAENLGKQRILENYERENCNRTRPTPHIRQFVSFLEQLQIKTALITNNSANNTKQLLQKFKLFFNLVVTRESGLWKPKPDAFFFVMNHYSLSPEEVISVGDSKYDILASQAANIDRIYILKSNIHRSRVENGICFFSNYHILIKILKRTMSTCRHC